MNPEDEYLVSKYLNVHRWASILLVQVAAGFYIAKFGLVMSLRPFSFFMLPLVLIWFSDQLTTWAIKDSGGWLNERNADTAVRVFGWLILFLLLVMLGMAYMAS
jgi:hypothetical protein